VVERALSQSTVVMVAPTIRRKDPDWYAALIVDRVLGGGGLQSRLFVEIREKRGLAYGAGCQLRSMRKAGLFIASTASANERVAEAVDVARSEIARMAREGPTDPEIAEAKTYFAGARALSLDSSSGIAGALHGLQIEGLPPDQFERQQAAIEAVSLAEALRVAAKMLRPELLTTVVVGQPVGISSTQ